LNGCVCVPFLQSLDRLFVVSLTNHNHAESALCNAHAPSQTGWGCIN
jgi:hypothetical protein